MEGGRAAPRAILGASAQDFVLIRRSRRLSAPFSESHRGRVFGEGADDSPRGAGAPLFHSRAPALHLT
jgi:hypothetical protein